MTSSRKWTYVAGGALALAVIASVSYFVIRQGDASAADLVDEAAAEELAVPVEVVQAIEGSVASTLATASTIEAEQSAEVLSKVAGVVTSVAAREGEHVREGQVLAKVDDEEKRLAREKAELTLKKAEAELQRAELSYGQQLISKFDYEKTVFDRDLAASELEAAELQLRYTDITAPFAGRVVAKEVVVGKAVKVGDHLFTLADFGTLVVRLFLPERDVFELEPGQPVKLVPEALAADGPETAAAGFKGRVREISPVVDPKTGTVKVTVEVVDRSTIVRPGAFVRAEIETDVRENTVLVPKIAVVREAGKDYLFIIDNGRAKRLNVELGYTRGGGTEVLSGVSPGDQVIVAGQTTLEDGELVEIVHR